jgi:hypothetical protein
MLRESASSTPPTSAALAPEMGAGVTLSSSAEATVSVLMGSAEAAVPPGAAPSPPDLTGIPFTATIRLWLVRTPALKSAGAGAAIPAEWRAAVLPLLLLLKGLPLEASAVANCAAARWPKQAASSAAASSAGAGAL